MFDFRIIDTADGNQIIDRKLKIPYNSLTPLQMVERDFPLWIGWNEEPEERQGRCGDLQRIHFGKLLASVD